MSDLRDTQELLNTHQYRGKTLPADKNFDELVERFKKTCGTVLPTAIPEVPMILYAWTGRIAQASRQCFNARIQGSAATLTKLAMVDIYNDKILNDCQAKLIIPVHDELLVECPAYYSDIVEKRLPEVMIQAAAKVGDDVPQACDAVCESRWYSTEYAAVILDEYQKLEQSKIDKESAVKTIIAAHSELPEQVILDVLSGKTDQLEF